MIPGRQLIFTGTGNVFDCNCQDPRRATVHKKPHLPTKTCEVCQRPFAWRKKWAKDWASVRYCSERCRRNRSKST